MKEGHSPLPILLVVFFVVDLPAHLVFLGIEGPLLLLRDVAAVLRSHIPLFLPDLVILFVELSCLALGQRAVLDSLVDPLILIREPFVA